MSIFEYLLLFFSVILSGVAVFFFKTTNRFYLKLILAFSGAYLFGITVLHLIPAVYQTDTATVGYFILLGFFIQIILEYFSEGIEHGHIHVHHHPSPAFPYSVIIGLSLHSFLEGMPLAHSHHEHGHGHSDQLLAGIVLHHLPVAFALVSMLIQSGVKKSTTIVMLIIFAAMAPLGAATSHLLSGAVIADLSLYYDKIMAVVIGIFLHISTTILFESTEDHRFNLYKLITICVGAGLSLIAF
jgi:zinc and cadmium transporter